MMNYLEIIKIFGPVAAIALFLVWVIFIFLRRTADKLDATDTFVRHELSALTKEATIKMAENNKIIETNTLVLRETGEIILRLNN
jgi:hypothetical protein